MVEYIFNILITRHFGSDHEGLQDPDFSHFIVILASTPLEPPFFILVLIRKNQQNH